MGLTENKNQKRIPGGLVLMPLRKRHHDVGTGPSRAYGRGPAKLGLRTLKRGCCWYF